MPTLVDDGVVHIESNDIIDYIDEIYPEPTLRAADNDRMMEWLRLAASIHVPAIKPYVYATKIARKLKKTVEEEEWYDEIQKNQELNVFHAKHKGASQFTGEDVAKAEAILGECITKLENTLEGGKWIMGDQYTLADISWIPPHFALIGCGYPFEGYPNITRWAAEFRGKKSFRGGIIKWCPDFPDV